MSVNTEKITEDLNKTNITQNKNVLLMRHGVSCSNRTTMTSDLRRWMHVQPLLTLNGIDQVTRSVENIKSNAYIDEDFYIVCSMLPRSLFTSCIVASLLNIKKVHVYPYIGEQYNVADKFNKFQNKSSQNFSTLEESLLYAEVIKYILKKIGLNAPDIDFRTISNELIKRNLFDPLPNPIRDVCTDPSKISDMIDNMNAKNILIVSHGDTLDELTNTKLWNNAKKNSENPFNANCSLLKCEYVNRKLVKSEKLVLTPYRDVCEEVFKPIQDKYIKASDDPLLVEGESDEEPVIVEAYRGSTSASGELNIVENTIKSIFTPAQLSKTDEPISLLHAFLTCRHHLHGMILIPYFKDKTLKEIYKYFTDQSQQETLEQNLTDRIGYFNEWIKGKNNEILYTKNVGIDHFQSIDKLEKLQWIIRDEPIY